MVIETGGAVWNRTKQLKNFMSSRVFQNQSEERPPDIPVRNQVSRASCAIDKTDNCVQKVIIGHPEIVLSCFNAVQ